VHSLSDLLTDVAVLAGLRVSGKPADTDHHYGHLRVTTLVTMFVGAALLATAAWIAFRGIITLRESHEPVRAVLPFWVAIVSVFSKEALYQMTVRVGRRVGDASIVANAWHHRSDSWTSIAAAAGLAGVALGGPSWAFLDHVTAVVLASFLLVIGAKILYDAAGELVDRAPDARTQAAIEAIVATTEGVRGYHAVRARRIGGKVAVDIRIHVGPELTVREGHDVATLVTRRLLECEHNVIEVVVHIEPEGDAHDGILL
jgi:cation diffusion facilitator family transporter